MEWGKEERLTWEWDEGERLTWEWDKGTWEWDRGGMGMGQGDMGLTSGVSLVESWGGLRLAPTVGAVRGGAGCRDRGGGRNGRMTQGQLRNQCGAVLVLGSLWRCLAGALLAVAFT